MNIITFQIYRLKLLIRNKFFGDNYLIPQYYTKEKDGGIGFGHKGFTMKIGKRGKS